MFLQDIPKGSRFLYFVNGMEEATLKLQRESPKLAAEGAKPFLAGAKSELSCIIGGREM